MPQNRMEMEADGHTAIAQLHAGGKFELSCGGNSYTSDFGLLFECAAGSGPTDGFEVSVNLVSFMIISAATPGEMFRCTPGG